MQILILDTIHGGIILGDALRKIGHTVNLVDVYRGDISYPGSITRDIASNQTYDLLIHPVHLDPADPLLRALSCPAITHHEAVRWILGSIHGSDNSESGKYIEISGTRGKTTTATALASLMPGQGILHTSRGICRYPAEENITRLSITPASLIPVHTFLSKEDWCIAEISLGFTGLSDLAILTSDEDYLVAAGKLSARMIKHMSALTCRRVLMAPGIICNHDNLVNAKDVTQVSGIRCSYSYEKMDGWFENPLLVFEGYRIPLQLAASAALILGFRPDRLKDFSPLPGRMKIISEKGRTIIDNASTGTCLKTTLDAITLLQRSVGCSYTLIIGQESRAVCENFPDTDIITAIRKGRPDDIVLIAGDDRMNVNTISIACRNLAIPITVSNSLSEGMQIAQSISARSIVISVKTWR
jgi:coenzyme F430 synthetase